MAKRAATVAVIYIYTPPKPTILSIKQGPKQGPIYSKKVAIIIKIYIDNQKYNKVNNSFNFKLIIFYNICKRSNLLLEGYIVAFPSILKGLT